MGHIVTTLLQDSLINSFLLLLAAILPILWLIISLGFFKIPAYKACILGLTFSLVIAVTLFQMPVILAMQAAGEGFVLALLPILWVIFAAFYTYNISLKTGAMDQIKNSMISLSGDRRIQVLAIAWGFGGFLEAVAGFGTAVAIPASILISLGFNPFLAAIVCLLANTIPVAFGVIGIPVTTLAKVTELPVMPLSLDVAFQLTPFVVLVPFLMILTVTKSSHGFKGVWGTTLIAGLSFAICQFLVAKYIGPELPAVIGSAASFTAIIVCAKLSPPSQEWHFSGEDYKSLELTVSNSSNLQKSIIAAVPYILLLILVLATSKLVPPVNQFLSQAKSAFFIYNGSGGKPLYVDWILTPGTLIFISTVISGFIQGASLRNLASCLVETMLQLRKTTVTVLSIVSMAKVLGYSGMVGFIAIALAESTGSFYPIVAPLIGALGTFITGSDTSANVLFGLLQKNVATQIAADPIWIAASNASGACAGKLISPQSIAIATAATGLLGREGDILNVTIKYVFGFIVALGIITYLFAF